MSYCFTAPVSPADRRGSVQGKRKGSRERYHEGLQFYKTSGFIKNNPDILKSPATCFWSTNFGHIYLYLALKKDGSHLVKTFVILSTTIYNKRNVFSQ
ncbi:hypothetical protein M0804_004757 [Polistes exclamans]|nr:hypothetical protein M0804_004757 [Polistes exclamans]